MKKASWIVLAVAGGAFILISLVSAVHAYNRTDDYGIGGVRVSKVAAGREEVDTTLGVSAGATQFALTMAGLLLDVRRPRS
jgi:hypothetical protein